VPPYRYRSKTEKITEDLIAEFSSVLEK